MKLFASPQLETRDLGNALQFVLTRNYGLVGNLAGPIVVGCFGFYSWREQSIVAMVFAAVGVVGLLINWIQGRETILRVSQTEVVARGNLDSWFATEISLPVEEITSLVWRAPNEDAGGVVVSCGYKQSYVLPGATEEQGSAIINAIAEKFPHFPVTDRTPASMLFGDDSGITTLDLSQSGSRSSDSHQ